MAHKTYRDDPIYRLYIKHFEEMPMEQKVAVEKQLPHGFFLDDFTANELADLRRLRQERLVFTKLSSNSQPPPKG